MKWLILWLAATAAWLGGWLWLVDRVPSVSDQTLPLLTITLGAILAYQLGRVSS